MSPTQCILPCCAGAAASHSWTRPAPRRTARADLVTASHSWTFTEIETVPQPAAHRAA
ncbi:MAG: hypothetical protein ACRDVG_00845 [Jatrophihabitantaceae bacterium]